LYRDGESFTTENITTHVPPDLAFIVEIERFRMKVAGRDAMRSISLLTTSVFRPEDTGWKIMHRQADTVTSARAPESVIQQ
jgi:ketosteroid isomerase-like protein